MKRLASLNLCDKYFYFPKKYVLSQLNMNVSKTIVLILLIVGICAILLAISMMSLPHSYPFIGLLALIIISVGLLFLYMWFYRD